MAWHLRHRAVTTLGFAQNGGTEAPERLLVGSIGATLAISSDDTVLGHGAYCGYHVEAHCRGHVLQLLLC